MRGENIMKSVVIVDDSTTARMCIKTCLENAGYQKTVFYEAQNGEEAITIIKNNDIVPDLVITDLNMPGMNGISLLKRLKSSPKYTNIPVVIITSAGSPNLKEELLSIGALAVLNKPISPASFSEILNDLSKDVETSWG